MKKVYCRYCGSEMTLRPYSINRGFDMHTGKPDIGKGVVGTCPNASWLNSHGGEYWWDEELHMATNMPL